MVLPAALLVLAFFLLVTGVVLIFLPAGLILAGVMLLLTALFLDPADVRRRKGRRR